METALQKVSRTFQLFKGLLRGRFLSRFGNLARRGSMRITIRVSPKLTIISARFASVAARVAS